jgi:hypothetical protein
LPGADFPAPVGRPKNYRPGKDGIARSGDELLCWQSTGFKWSDVCESLVAQGVEAGFFKGVAIEQIVGVEWDETLAVGVGDVDAGNGAATRIAFPKWESFKINLEKVENFRAGKVIVNLPAFTSNPPQIYHRKPRSAPRFCQNPPAKTG